MYSLCISMGSIGITGNLGAGNHQLGTGNYSFLLLCVPLYSFVFFLCVPMHSHVFLRGLEQYLVTWGLPTTTWTLGAIPMYSCVFLCIPMYSYALFVCIPAYSYVFLRGLEQYLVTWGLATTTWALGAIPMYSYVFVLLLCIPVYSYVFLWNL